MEKYRVGIVKLIKTSVYCIVCPTRNLRVFKGRDKKGARGRKRILERSNLCKKKNRSTRTGLSINTVYVTTRYSVESIKYIFSLRISLEFFPVFVHMSYKHLIRLNTFAHSLSTRTLK